MRVKKMYRYAIDCEVLTGAQRGKRKLIPRIHFNSSSSAFPPNFRRTQLPVILFHDVDEFKEMVIYN